MDKMDKIINLIKQDKLRIEVLACVHKLGLPQCYVAAGFVRNLVWDHLHHKTIATPLNDIDVIYFDSNEDDDQAYSKYEAMLSQQMPQVNWQVRNQAKMHIHNGDKPYQSIIDAMSYWPEKETAVAIRKVGSECYQCISSFGFESLFNLDITHNPKRDRIIFENRLKSKNWLDTWSKLKLAALQKNI